MRFFIQSINRRVNESQLSRMGLTPESDDVYALIDQRPDHNSSYESVADLGTVSGDPEAGFKIDYTIVPKQYSECSTVLKELIASLRFKKQEAGILVNDTPVRSAKYDRDMLRDTVDELEAGTIASVKWKASTGWLTLGLAELKPLRTAVVQHIQACFEHESALCELIDALGGDDQPDDWFDQLMAINLSVHEGWPATLEDTANA